MSAGIRMSARGVEKLYPVPAGVNPSRAGRAIRMLMGPRRVELERALLVVGARAPERAFVVGLILDWAEVVRGAVSAEVAQEAAEARAK